MGSSTAAPPDLADSRVLIVDDEPANVRLLERILETNGYGNRCDTSDPREVRDLLRSFQPDIVLLDLLMPHMDGFEVMELVRSRTPAESFLPILVLTADATTQTKFRALAAGASDFLTKPFDQAEALLRIRNLLQTRKLHAALQLQNEKLDETVAARTQELQMTVDELREVDRERRTLLGRLVNAAEEERRLVANNIHDDAVQKLTAVGMRIHTLRGSLGDGEVEPLDRLEEIVGQTIERLRHLLFELNPPSLSRTGLTAALREYLSLPEESLGHWEIDDQLESEPSEDMRSVAYRIVVEAITNIRKHAKADSTSIRLRNADRGIAVSVQDDGVGFSPQEASDLPHHMGLASMRERAELAGGRIQIRSLPGGGTTIEFWLPDSVGAA
jgi:signal transduction histidine kinase